MPPKNPPYPEKPEELRLFPLNLVLFPGMHLPLYIFEERYKVMIGECVDANLPFGVVLIREGPEVGGPASPHKIGTTARIIHVEHLEMGQMNLLTKGERRFRIHKITQEIPFLMGEVEYLEDTLEDDLGELAKTASRYLEEYWKILARLKSGWLSHADIPQDPVSLSFAIGQTVGDPPMVGQYLIQIPSVKERLDQELPLLKERLQLAKKALNKHNPYQGPRLN